MSALKTVIRLFWVPRFKYLHGTITHFQRGLDTLLPDLIEFAITRHKEW
jgi:hypothetical protein